MKFDHFLLFNKKYLPIYINFPLIGKDYSLSSILMQTVQFCSKCFKIYHVQNFVFVWSAL